jgi:hypothetical protein
MIDSYVQLFQLLPKKKFFKFGLDNMKCIPEKVALEMWKELLCKIDTKHSKLFIRGLGRNGQQNDLMVKMYREVFDLRVNIDKTNNQKARLVLEKGTKLRKQENIVNYQVSHVFGRTKNVYCFTSPWNIVYIPKVLDPFTGHEAQGKYVKVFQRLFRMKVYNSYESSIEEFNKRMIKAHKLVKDWCEINDPESKLKTLIDDFKPIKKEWDF